MKWIMLFVAFSGILSSPAGADDSAAFVEKAATRELIDQLRKGGFVLYMRHGNSDTSRPDRVPQVDLDDCATQRPLTEKGRRVAAQVGAAIRKAHIPLGEILVSPMCRTKDTANAAFGKQYKVDNNLMYTSNLTSEEKAVRVQAARAFLSKPVPVGTNRILVAHAPNLMDTMGYFPSPEATVVIFKPEGEKGFEYLASIHPDDWPQFLK